MPIDPGFSSDKILEEYRRLNEIDWTQDNSEPEDDEPINEEE